MDEPLNRDDIHYTTVNGIRTRYLDANRSAGAAIVLIHGGHFGIFVPMSMEIWSETVEPLSRHGRVVAFDKLGQGCTDLPPDDEHWTLDSVVDHAKGLLEQLDLTDITLVGHSRGGLLAIRLAIELPDRVSRLVVVSSATAAPTPPGWLDSAFYDEVERTAPTDAGPEAVIGHYHAAQAVTEGPLSPEYIRIAADMMTGRSHAESVRGLARNSERHWLPSLQRVKQSTLDHLQTSGLTIPVLLVWGHDDRSAPVHLGYEFFRILAGKTDNCSMLVINRAGHQVFRDQPSTFNDAIAGLLTA